MLSWAGYDGDLSGFRLALPVREGKGRAGGATERGGWTMGREKGEEPLSVADVAALTKMFEEHRPRLLVMLQSRIDPAMGSACDRGGRPSRNVLPGAAAVAPIRGLGDDALLLALPARHGHASSRSGGARTATAATRAARSPGRTGPRPSRPSS